MSTFQAAHSDRLRLRRSPFAQGLPLDCEQELQETRASLTISWQGYTEVRYDEEKKRVVYEPLQLTQAFRNFADATSPWGQDEEGIDYQPKVRHR